MREGGGVIAGFYGRGGVGSAYVQPWRDSEQTPT